MVGGHWINCSPAYKPFIRAFFWNWKCVNSWKDREEENASYVGIISYFMTHLLFTITRRYPNWLLTEFVLLQIQLQTLKHQFNETWLWNINRLIGAYPVNNCATKLLCKPAFSLTSLPESILTRFPCAVLEPRQVYYMSILFNYEFFINHASYIILQNP